MSALITLKGCLEKNVFISSTGQKINYVPFKNVKYDAGPVYALFEVIGTTYILCQTIPVDSFK